MTGSIKAKTKLRLREMLDEAIAQGVTAGVSLGIWQDGEELFFTAQGYACLLYTSHMPFRICMTFRQMVWCRREEESHGGPVRRFLPQRI